MRFNIFIFITLSFLFVACNAPATISLETEFQQGELVTKVITRGSYQYVLESGNKVYYPVNLTEDFQNDTRDAKRLAVRFKGKLLDSKTQIFQPGANDAPKPDFKCQDITLTIIEKR